MRPVTKKAIYVVLGVVVALLALGALPGLLKSGDPYYVTATPADEWPAANHSAINGSVLPESRYPYTTGALQDAGPNTTGRSKPYWKGPVGFKGVFTHSPFDERDAIVGRNPNATVADAFYARYNDTVYRVAIVQEER